MSVSYGFGKQVDGSMDEVVDKVKKALAEVGFGILTEIDVKATLKKKIDKDVAPYLILGACNPKLASRALEVEESIGLLLPCNVVVRESEGGKISVEFLDPNAISGLAGGGKLDFLAAEARPLLEKAMAAL